MNIRNTGILTLFVMIFATIEALGAQDFPEITEDGLVRVKDSNLALVYADPEAEISGYTRVRLLDAEVAFKKNWERDQRASSINSLSMTNDIRRIKKDLAEEFRNVFTAVLEEGGYSVVDEDADDVLLVRPSIVNLDITAPQTSRAANIRQQVRSAGEMTLYIELYDSVTGDLIAKALDRQADRENSDVYTWANRASNRAAADRILKGWAEILLNALNEANGR
jgi:hypothetical protein